jgi:hypothetical protein
LPREKDDLRWQGANAQGGRKVKRTRHTVRGMHRGVACDKGEVADESGHCQHNSVFVENSLLFIVFYNKFNLNLMFFREGTIEHPGLFTVFIPYENL